MRVFQMTGIVKMMMEDYKIGFEKLWLYAGHGAGKYAGYPGKNNRRPQRAVRAGL